MHFVDICPFVQVSIPVCFPAPEFFFFFFFFFFFVKESTLIFFMVDSYLKTAKPNLMKWSALKEIVRLPFKLNFGYIHYENKPIQIY